MSYQQSVNLEGQGEQTKAVIEVSGSDERVQEFLARLGPMLANIRAEMIAREKAGVKVPCKSCGDK
jgi:hypothetical protein